MAPNDDWLFTPQLSSNTFDEVTLWARSLNSECGLEDFQIGVSYTDTDPMSFTILQINNDIPIDWTEYTVNISGYSGQAIYIGIHVVSNDVFAFGLDDLEVTGSGVGPCDDTPPITTCTLNGIFDGAVYIGNVMVVFEATDNWSGVNTTKTAMQFGRPLKILGAVEAVNDAQKLRLVEKIEARMGTNLAGRCFALWGLAFKPNTDDMREAPAREIIAALSKRGARIVAYDPVAMTEAKRIYGEAPWLSYATSPMAALPGADALVVVTEWKEFRSPDFPAIRAALASPLVFDGRNLYEPADVRAAGLEYFAIGRH